MGCAEKGWLCNGQMSSHLSDKQIFARAVLVRCTLLSYPTRCRGWHLAAIYSSEDGLRIVRRMVWRADVKTGSMRETWAEQWRSFLHRLGGGAEHRLGLPKLWPLFYCIMRTIPRLCIYSTYMYVVISDMDRFVLCCLAVVLIQSSP